DSIARRALILKSDRDTKEQVKEKPEKEKQPTIILKTREQSTPKEDRPQSPKASKPLTDDGPVPCKIAYNGNKEKRSTSGVGKSMVMNILASNDHDQDFCHRILNSHETPADAFEPHNVAVENEMAALNFVDAADNKAKETNNKFLFKMQSIEHIERGVHCTKASLIEETSASPVTVRSANIAMVDCLQVASFLMAVCHVLIPLQDWFTDYNFISSESTTSGESHPHMLLLHNRCQLEDFTPESVRAMQDLYSSGESHPHMLLLHNRCQLEDFTPESVRAMQDLYSSEESLVLTSSGESHPHMLLLHNRCQLEDFTPESVRAMQDLYSSEESLVLTSSGESHPHMLLLHNRCQLEDFTPESVRAMQDLYSSEESLVLTSSGESHPHMLLLHNRCQLEDFTPESVTAMQDLYSSEESLSPRARERATLTCCYCTIDNRYIYRGHPPFDVLARRLRWTVLGASRHQLTSVPSLSERGWFHYCSKAWETVTKCTFYLEYERFLP
ncbi:Protein SMG9, partial [Operophtera brumata]